MRATTKHKPIVPLSAAQQALVAETSPLQDLADRETLDLWRSALPAHLWRTVWDRIGMGRTLQEVADKERISKEGVRQRILRAAKLMRKLAGEPA